MGTRCVVLLCLVSFLFYGARLGSAQDDSSIHVNVVLVQLNVAVTDSKGNYVSGLRPEDFQISEDGIPEKVATFEEGNEPMRRLTDAPGPAGQTKVAEAQAVCMGKLGASRRLSAEDVAKHVSEGGVARYLQAQCAL